MAMNRYQQGSVEVIQIGDRLTVEEVELARTLLTQATENVLPQVVLDLRSLRLVDSAGLTFLLDSTHACERKGGQLRLAGVGSLVAEVLEITGLESEFNLHADVVVAAGAFAR